MSKRRREGMKKGKYEIRVSGDLRKLKIEEEGEVVYEYDWYRDAVLKDKKGLRVGELLEEGSKGLKRVIKWSLIERTMRWGELGKYLKEEVGEELIKKKGKEYEEEYYVNVRYLDNEKIEKALKEVVEKLEGVLGDIIEVLGVYEDRKIEKYVTILEGGVEEIEPTLRIKLEGWGLRVYKSKYTSRSYAMLGGVELEEELELKKIKGGIRGVIKEKGRKEEKERLIKEKGEREGERVWLKIEDAIHLKELSRGVEYR